MALSYAITALDGKKDLDGKPAVLHSMDVGLVFQDDICRSVGFLHDIVEDTDKSFDDLEEAGFAVLIPHLILLTHDKNVEYYEYIKNIIASGDDVAIKVKLADLANNIQRGKAGNHEKQLKKHLHAAAIFKEHGYGIDLL